MNGKDESGIAQAERAIHSCRQAFIDLTYKYNGRMMIAIDDETPDERQCAMEIRTHSDRIRELDCKVPSNRLVSWNGLEDPDSPDLSWIERDCKVISAFKGSIDPSQ